MKTALFERFEITMSDEAVDDCNHQGACDDDVEHWHGKIDLSHITDKQLHDELREYGAWDEEELKDRTENEKRIIWIAAGNILDDEGGR